VSFRVRVHDATSAGTDHTGALVTAPPGPPLPHRQSRCLPAPGRSSPPGWTGRKKSGVRVKDGRRPAV